MNMENFNVQITIDGAFTCDIEYFVSDIHDGAEYGFNVYCPDFETIQELAEWIAKNSQYFDT